MTNNIQNLSLAQFVGKANMGTNTATLTYDEMANIIKQKAKNSEVFGLLIEKTNMFHPSGETVPAEKTIFGKLLEVLFDEAVTLSSKYRGIGKVDNNLNELIATLASINSPMDGPQELWDSWANDFRCKDLAQITKLLQYEDIDDIGKKDNLTALPDIRRYLEQFTHKLAA